MYRSTLLLFSLFICIAVGCNESSSSKREGTPLAQPAPGALAARLEAAKSIQSVNEHDNALADLARDAGKAGDATVAKAAISSIRSSDLHDNAAANAALELAWASQFADASEIAKLIRQTSLRDKTLAKIAKDD